MTFFTYILKSKVANITYVGHTNNIKRRLNQHNSGYGVFSKRYIPWEIIHLESYNSEEESISREKYLKSGAGRRWIKKNLFKEI